MLNKFERWSDHCTCVKSLRLSNLSMNILQKKLLSQYMCICLFENFTPTDQCMLFHTYETVFVLILVVLENSVLPIG